MGINMQNDINTDLYEEIEKLLIKFNLSENERKTFAYKLTYSCKSFMGTAVYEWTPKCADLTGIEGGDLLVSLREANNFAQNVFIEENVEDIKSKVRNHFKEITVKTILFLFEVKTYIAEEKIFEISQNIQDIYCDKKLNVNTMCSIDENPNIEKKVLLSVITLF